MKPDDVRLAELPSIPLAVVRRQVSRSDLSAAVREGCGRAWTFARGHNLTAGQHRGVPGWDDPPRRRVELPAPFTEGDGIIRSARPAGLVAGGERMVRTAYVTAWRLAFEQRLPERTP